MQYTLQYALSLLHIYNADKVIVHISVLLPVTEPVSITHYARSGDNPTYESPEELGRVQAANRKFELSDDSNTAEFNNPIYGSSP